MRNTKFATAILMGALLAASQLAFADDDDDDSRGQIFSASAFIIGTDPVTIAEVPKRSNYVLTQYCVTGGGAGMGPLLEGTVFGLVPSPDPCTTYTPGILFEGGQALRCTAQFAPPPGFSVACMVTGYMLDRKDD
jgi:hypothetical protein